MREGKKKEQKWYMPANMRDQAITNGDDKCVYAIKCAKAEAQKWCKDKLDKKNY